MSNVARRVAMCGVVLTVAAVSAGPAVAVGPPTVPPQRVASGACDPLDPTACLLPFPDNYFTVPDPTSATGLRVHFARDSMPSNIFGHVDPTEWNRQDGFSPGTPILLHVPNLDTTASGIPAVTDIGASLAPDAPIVLLNTRTGARTPYWAELDAHDAGSSDQLLIIRPAVALQDGARYVVGLRNLKDTSGHTIAAPATFTSYVRGHGNGRHDARAQQMKRILADLTTAGVKRQSLYLAWDFTVASEQNLTGRVLAMRDQAFAALGTAAPSFTIASVVNHPTGLDGVARQVKGIVAVPSFLTGTGAPGARLHYGPAGASNQAGLPPAPDALPTPSGGTIHADFVCNIPDSASAAHPATLSLYGHGLLGSPTEINAGNVRDMSQGHDFMFCATSWTGMAAADRVYDALTFTNLSMFPSIPDRLQQSFVNFLFLGRAMDTTSGFAADPAFQDAGGKPLINVAGGLHYDGNSQGGIDGGALTAIAQDWTRSVLGVTGMDYSLLLQRSADFTPFQQILDGTSTLLPPGADPGYPDKVTQQIILGLLQMLWDRGEADGYASHMTSDPLPGTPAHQVLMQVAFGDHQVSTAAAAMEARTIGAHLHTPAVQPASWDQYVPTWGISPITHYPYTGSAMFIWNSGTSGIPPTTNLAPTSGIDPHEYPRAQANAQQQKAVFLTTGKVIDVCNGGACQ